jgi:DNA-binding PadR family transcriptional regulator
MWWRKMVPEKKPKRPLTDGRRSSPKHREDWLTAWLKEIISAFYRGKVVGSFLGWLDMTVKLNVNSVLLFTYCVLYSSAIHSIRVTANNYTMDFSRQRQEMRRGSLVLAVLAALKVEHYGYSLRKELNEMGLEIEEGTLYPMIRRLAEKGFLNSRWQQVADRKKRYYQLSEQGEMLLSELTDEWHSVNRMIEKLVG